MIYKEWCENSTGEEMGVVVLKKKDELKAQSTESLQSEA